MKRVTDYRKAEPVAAALRLLTGTLHDLASRCDVFTADPLLAGLHRYETASYSRSFRNTAHVAYPWNQELPSGDQVVTVVLPEVVDLHSAVHELGHVVDYWTGFSHKAEPVSWYAKTDRYEAFAEAFAYRALRGPDHVDAATAAFFEALS